MENLKEIAKIISKKIYIEDGILLSSYISEKFAEALLAEIAKENEPVAFKFKKEGWANWFYREEFPAQEASENYLIAPLYTFPPSAEQIENRVAEACADVLDSCGSVLGAAIRSGIWKEYLK